MHFSLNRSKLAATVRLTAIGTILTAFVIAAVAPVSAEPPPWAPAHGYRAKHKGKHKKQYAEVYVAPFDLDLGRCNRDLLGAVLGGAGGAAMGSTIGKGDGRTAAIVGGAILGILVGGSIGRAMDDVDQHCIGQALEHAQDGRTIVWNNPQNQTQYSVAPTRTVQVADGRYCREYTTTSVIAGKTQQAYGRACRQPDGSWEIQN
jgi:surface antigen